MDFVKLDQIAAEFMKNRRFHMYRETGSVYYHGARVAQGVLQLRRRVTHDASYDDILRCAAMFHDIAKGMKPHSHFGAMLVRDILRDELSAYELENVCRLIEAHGDRRPAREFHDMWVWLLQDADLLDHVGTYEIWLSCNYYAYQQRPMEDILEWYTSQFDAQMADYRARLNFDVSRDIFDSKVEFEHMFIRRLIVENSGRYFEEVVE